MAKYKDLNLNLPLLLIWGARIFAGIRNKKHRKSIQNDQVCVVVQKAKLDQLGLFAYCRRLSPAHRYDRNRQQWVQ